MRGIFMKSSIKLVLPLMLALTFSQTYAADTKENEELKIKVCEQQKVIDSLQAQMAEYMSHFELLVKNLQEMQTKFQMASTQPAQPVTQPTVTAPANLPVNSYYYTAPAPIYYSYYDVNREKIFQPQPQNNYYFEQTIPHFQDYFALSRTTPTLLPATAPAAAYEAPRFNFETPSTIINPKAQGFNFGFAPML